MRAPHVANRISDWTKQIGFVPSGGLLAALLRGEAIKEEIFRSEDLLSTREMADRLGVPVETVRRWRRQSHLLGLPRRGRGYLYPSWQIVDQRPLPRLVAIGGYFNFDPWAIYLFLTETLEALNDETPLAAILAGRTDLIIGMAAGIAEGGVL